MHFKSIRIAFVWPLGLMATLLCSCTGQQTNSMPEGKLVVEEQVVYPEGMGTALSKGISQIHVGMTFKEIAQITPIYTNGLQLVEHGGIWFHSPAGTNWIVMLRFENPTKQPDVLKRKLNMAPMIRARVPNESSL